MRAIIEVFQMHVNCDRNLVEVTSAPEKDLLEEAKIFSSHLCKQRQIIIRSIPLSRHFSS